MAEQKVQLIYDDGKALEAAFLMTSQDIEQLKGKLKARLAGAAWGGKAKTAADEVWNSRFEPAFNMLTQANLAMKTNMAQFIAALQGAEDVFSNKVR